MFSLLHRPHRGLQLPHGQPRVHKGRRLLLQHGFLPRDGPGDELLHNVLAGVERRPCSRHDRRHHHAQLFHHVQQFPRIPAGGVQSKRHERVGQCLHVLHLCVFTRVRGGELRRKEETQTQHGLHAWRECGHPGINREQTCKHRFNVFPLSPFYSFLGP